MSFSGVDGDHGGDVGPAGESFAASVVSPHFLVCHVDCGENVHDLMS